MPCMQVIVFVQAQALGFIKKGCCLLLVTGEETDAQRVLARFKKLVLSARLVTSNASRIVVFSSPELFFVYY